MGGDEGVGHRSRARACRSGPANLVGKPQVSQDAGDHGGVVDHRNQPESPATAGTRENIQTQAAAHEVRPEIVPARAVARPRYWPDACARSRLPSVMITGPGRTRATGAF